MGRYTIQRGVGKKVRVLVQWGPSHTTRAVNAFHKDLQELVKKHDLTARRPRKK